MAILLRSRQQISKMREAGRLVAETFELLRPHVRPGVSTRELDQIAEKFIRSRGAIPVYKGYNGFPATICVAVNNVICHGFPSKTPLRQGDIVGIDIGAKVEVHRIVAELAASGLGIVLISSDLPEVIAMSDRILVLHEGRLSGEIDGRTATEEQVMTAATGQQASDVGADAAMPA